MTTLNTNLEARTQEIVDFLIEKSRETLLACKSDKLSSGWNYLRWYPESLEEMQAGNFGKVHAGRDASPCYPESEYFNRGNCPITFWEDQTNPGWSSADCGLEWVECNQEEARYLVNRKSDYACAGDEEQILKLATRSGLGEFETAQEAADAIVSSGGYWFTLGNPVDGLDTSELTTTLERIVADRLQWLMKNPNE